MACRLTQRWYSGFAGPVDVTPIRDPAISDLARAARPTTITRPSVPQSIMLDTGYGRPPEDGTYRVRCNAPGHGRCSPRVRTRRSASRWVVARAWWVSRGGSTHSELLIGNDLVERLDRRIGLALPVVVRCGHVGVEHAPQLSNWFLVDVHS